MPTVSPCFERSSVRAGQPGRSRSRARSLAPDGEVEGVRLCWCPPVRFVMGSPPGEIGRRADEAQVDVTLVSRGRRAAPIPTRTRSEAFPIATGPTRASGAAELGTTTGSSAARRSGYVTNPSADPITLASGSSPFKSCETFLIEQESFSVKGISSLRSLSFAEAAERPGCPSTRLAGHSWRRGRGHHTGPS